MVPVASFSLQQKPEQYGTYHVIHKSYHVGDHMTWNNERMRNMWKTDVVGWKRITAKCRAVTMTISAGGFCLADSAAAGLWLADSEGAGLWLADTAWADFWLADSAGVDFWLADSAAAGL